MWTVAVWICAIAVSLVSLQLFSAPYLWIFPALALALFITAAMDRGRRALWVNIACLSIGLAIFEYYLWTSSEREFEARRVEEGNFEERLFASHEQLGWAPQADTLVTQKLSFEGEVFYDARYTIGPNGLRVSSPATNGSSVTNGHGLAAECILFFGGSFTFGQGLADDETLPYQVHAQSTQRYRTYNFGVNGYGAHQMLSALQHGLVRDVVQCDPTRVSHVFYQGITDHISRSGRPWIWRRGPKYVLTENGEVRRDGRFEDSDDHQKGRSLIDRLGAQMHKSMIYRKLVHGKYIHKYSSDERDLYLAIIEVARSRVLADYPAAEFHVLLWDEDNADNIGIRQGLAQRGIRLHLMSDILPNYRADDLNQQYRIHVRDPHPNAFAIELIAEYLVRDVLGEPGTEPEVGAGGPAPGSAISRRQRS